MPIKRNTRLWLIALGLLVFAGVLWGAAIKQRAPLVLAAVSDKVSLVGAALTSSNPDNSPRASAKTDNSDPVSGKAGEPVSNPADPSERVAQVTRVPKPEWSGMLPKKLSPDDKCFRLKGLAHNIYKCWSVELYDDGRGISRFLYHTRRVR